MFQQKTIIYILFLSCLLLWGCSNEADSLEVKTTQSIEVTLVKSTVTEPPVIYPTQTHKITPIPTQSPTASAKRTLNTYAESDESVQIIAHTQSAETLTSRYPTIDELDVFLNDSPEAYYHPNEDPFKNVELIFEDVNGDSEDDLILTNHLYLSVFLWLGERYSSPFTLIGSTYKYSPQSKVTLADWTNDDVSEIVFEYNGDVGGSAIVHNFWKLYIITCETEACHIAWNPLVARRTNQYDTGGIAEESSTLKLQVDAQGNPSVEQAWDGFSIYSNNLYHADLRLHSLYNNIETDYKPFETLRVLTKTMSIYTWNGKTFGKTIEEVIQDAYIIDQGAAYDAQNGEDTAEIIYESNGKVDALSDICHLFINKNPVGERFSCHHNFTSARWQNIVGDERKELIVEALSRPYAEDINGEIVSPGATCVHQKLMIHQWDGETANQIGNVTGCVVQSDLYGVTLFDIDGDGQLEISAANRLKERIECQIEANTACRNDYGYTHQIYRWDGKTFKSEQELSRNDLTISTPLSIPLSLREASRNETTQRPILASESLDLILKPPISTTASTSQIITPTLDEINESLRLAPGGYFHKIAVGIDQFRENGLSDIAEITFQDLNGDDKADILVKDELLVAIFLQQEAQYSRPFIFLEGDLSYITSAIFRIEDWTGDGVQDVIFDFSTISSGAMSGASYKSWGKHIITCGNESCHIAITLGTGSIAQFSDEGGVQLFEVNTQPSANSQGVPIIETYRKGFSFYNYTYQYFSELDIPGDSLLTFTTTQSIYTWNGINFNLTESTALEGKSEIREDSILEAAHANNKAKITYESYISYPGSNDACQLQINNIEVGKAFGCKADFTKVRWQNIVGDTDPELIITAASGGIGFDRQNDELVEIVNLNCVHQRKIIYQWDGETAIEIANVAGCMVQSDLYGVQLLDYDGDGQLEIIAASRWFTNDGCRSSSEFRCWYEFGYTHHIYKWNGEKFEFWQEVAKLPMDQ